MNDVVSQLVFCENGSDVDSVIVNGEVVVENGRLTKVDEQEVLRLAEQARQRLDPSIQRELAAAQKYRAGIGSDVFPSIRPTLEQSDSPGLCFANRPGTADPGVQELFARFNGASKNRSSLVPFRGLLVSIANPKAGYFFERRRDDLKSRRQISFSKAAGKESAGSPVKLNGLVKLGRRFCSLGSMRCKSLGRARRAGYGKNIDMSEIRADLFVQDRARALRGDVIYRA